MSIAMKATKKNPKLNVKLLRKIQRHILEEPRRFFMGWYFATGEPGAREWTECEFKTRDLPPTVPACGTAACIAGWANILSGRPVSEADDVSSAQVTLGITTQEVFAAESWPKPFRLKYRKAKTPKTRAKIAAERIEHLIQTGE